MKLDEIYFIHHTRGPHRGYRYVYPCDPGYGYWVHLTHTGNPTSGPYDTLKEARRGRREIMGAATTRA